jgi:hypothetical protein
MPAAVTDTPNRYLNLAIKYFERAEKAESPALQAKLREVAGEYRDQALRLMALQLDAYAKGAYACAASGGRPDKTGPLCCRLSYRVPMPAITSLN